MSKVFLITNQELNKIYASETKKLYDALLVASEDQNVTVSEAIADLFKDNATSELTPIDWDSAVNKKELILVSESEMAYIVQTMHKRFANLIEFKHSNNPKLSLAEILDSMIDLKEAHPDVVIFEKPMFEIAAVSEEPTPIVLEDKIVETSIEAELESDKDEVIEEILEPESNIESEELDYANAEIVDAGTELTTETEELSYDEEEEIENSIEVPYSEAKTFDEILVEAGAAPIANLPDEEPEAKLEIVTVYDVASVSEKPKKKGWFSRKSKAVAEVKEEPVEEAPAFVFGATEAEPSESVDTEDIKEAHDEIDYTEPVKESYEPELEYESTDEFDIELESSVETELEAEDVIVEEVIEPVAEADPNIPAFVFGKNKPVIATVEEEEPYESKMALEEITEVIEESSLEEVIEQLDEIESSEIIEEPSETLSPVFAEKPKKKGWFSRKSRAVAEVKEEPVEEAPAFIFGATEASYQSVVSYPSEKSDYTSSEPVTNIVVESFEPEVESSVETELEAEDVIVEEVIEPVAEADPNVPAFVFGKNKPVIATPALEVETAETTKNNVNDIVVEDELEAEDVIVEEFIEPVAEADPNVPAFVFGKNKPVIATVEEEQPLASEIEILNNEEETAVDAVESFEDVEEEITIEESTPVFVKPKNTGILADLSEYFDDAEESESVEASTVAVFPKPNLESSVEVEQPTDSLDENDIQVEDTEDSESADNSEDELPADEVEAEAIIDEVVETVTTPESPEAAAIRIAVATAVAQTLAEVKKQEKAEKKQKKEKKEKAKPVVLQMQPNQDGNMPDTQSIFGTAQPSNIVMNVESLNLSSSGGVVANIDGGNISLGGEEDPIYIHSLSRKRQMYALPERDEEENSDVNEPLRPDEDVNIRAIIKEIKIIDTF